MGRNLRKGLVKIGKWGLVITVIALVTFFVHQYVQEVLAAHTTTVFWHDTTDGTVGKRILTAGGASTTMNLSITSSGGTVVNFNLSVPVGWNITAASVTTGGGSIACDNDFGSGQAGSCQIGASVGKALRWTTASITTTPGRLSITVASPTNSRNGTWGWASEVSGSDTEKGNLFTIALDNGDIGFDVRQASNSNSPQTDAQATLIVSNNTNSTTIVNNTEWGDGLFLLESAFFNTKLTGSVTNYSFTVSRASDFLRAPNKIISYASGSPNSNLVIMNNSGAQGINITVLDELNTTRTWGDITISLYNVTTGTAACSDSELLLRNTTPPGTNSIQVSLNPIGTTTGVYVQANKSGYVKTPCVQLNSSSTNTTNITFMGQANLAQAGYGGTGRAANCTTPVMFGSNSTCGGLNFTIRVRAENQFGSTLPLAPTNTSFIAYDSGTDDPLWPNFQIVNASYLSNEAYLNFSGTGVFAVNKTGYVITNFTNTNSTNDDRQQIVVFEDGASAVQNYIAGPALNYTIKVFGYNELNLGAFGTGSTDVFNGQIGINRTFVTYATEISFGSNNDTYIAANATGVVPLSGINISLARTGFVNRTVVVTPNPFNITEVWFGNGTDNANSCGNTSGSNSTNIYNCTGALLYVLKVRTISEFGINIPGFTLYVNATGGTPPQNYSVFAIDGGLNDVNSTADGFLYWAINATNYTNTPTSGNLNPVFINTTPGGFLEANTTIGQYINDSTQLSLVLKPNYTVIVRTISQDMFELGGTIVNNVTWNTTLAGGPPVAGNIIECTQNTTNRQFWGCNATSNVANNISFPVYVNTSQTSGYMNATNSTVLANLPARYSNQVVYNMTLNYTVLAVANTETSLLVYSPTAVVNVTNVTYRTSGAGLNCFKNATNTSVWGCPVSLSAGLQNISFNVSDESGFLNSTNATAFTLPSGTNATQTTVLGNILYSIRVRTLDNFGNIIESPNPLSNVTNVTYVNNTAQANPIYCIKNTTSTQFWHCAVPVGFGPGNISVNVSGSGGHMNFNISTDQIPPTTAFSNQTRLDSSNNFTLMLITKNEFSQYIYGGAAANITNVTYFNSTQVVCIKNSTAGFSFSWGCRVGIGSTAVGNITFNLTDSAPYLTYTIFNQPIGATVEGLPTVNTSFNKFTVLATTWNEFNTTINGTGMSVTFQNATSVVNCLQNTTNGSAWGCQVNAGTPAAAVAATAPGYLNYTTATLTPPSTPFGAQALTTTYNNFTVVITTKDEFANFIVSSNSTGSNVTNIDYQNSTGQIRCFLNQTNTSNWGCAIPVGFSAGVIQVNVSSGAGYLNGSNSTPYTLPSSVLDQQTRNETRLRHTILVVTRNEFYTNFTIGNVTNVTFNANNVNARPCVNSSTNPQEWGCRVAVTDAAATINSNTSAESGFRNATSVSTAPPSTTGSLLPILVNITHQFNLNVTTADELGVNFRDADSVQFYNGSTQILCLRNVTNTSVWGCPAPTGNSQNGNANVTDARYINYTSGEVVMPGHSLAPSRIISANGYTLRINVNDSSNTANSFTDARVIVKNGTNDVVIYDYQGANVTSGNKTGAYLFAVNSTAYPRVYIEVSRTGYASYIDYNTSIGVNNNITIRTAIASGAQMTRNILIGIVAPELPTLVSPPDNFVTSSNRPSFVWTNVTGSGLRYEFQIDDNTNFTSPTYSINATNTSVAPTSALSDGSYAWRVRALDTSNNSKGFTAARTITVDTTAPATPSILYPTAGSNVSGTVTINASASDAGSGIAAVEFYKAGILIGNVTSSPFQIDWITDVETDGEYALNVRAIDKASNTANSSEVRVTTNNTPVASILNPANQTTTGINTRLDVSSSKVAQCRYILDSIEDSAFSVMSSTNSTVHSQSFSNLAGGSHRVRVNCIDTLSRISANVTSVWTVDTSGPQVGAVGVDKTTVNSSVTVNTTISYNGPLGNITSGNFWNKTFGVLPLSSEAGNSSVHVIDGLFDETQEDIGVRVDLSTLSDGDYWVCIKGNVSGTTQGPAGCSVRVQLDKTTPKVIIVSPDNGTTSSSTQPTMQFRVLDEATGTGINVSSISVFNFSSTGAQTNAANLNFDPSNNCTSVNGIFEYSCVFTSNASLRDTTRNNFSISVGDKAGNVRVNTTNFTVDSTATITASLITIIRDVAVANNSYEGGWAFRFNISTGTAGNATRLKMANWTLSGSSSTVIAIHDNVVMNYTDTQGNARTYNVTNTYNESAAVFGLQDLDATAGTQANVSVFVKIPAGTQSGSYSTTFAFGLYTGA